VRGALDYLERLFRFLLCIVHGGHILPCWWYPKHTLCVEVLCVASIQKKNDIVLIFFEQLWHFHYSVGKQKTVYIQFQQQGN
jgi:hypothetical protein